MAQLLLMTFAMFVVIDLESLASVFGGQAAPAAPPPGQQPQQPGGQPQAAGPQGAGPDGCAQFLSFLDQFLAFLQSPQFAQMLGGFRQMVSGMQGMGGQPGADGQGAPAAGATAQA